MNGNGNFALSSPSTRLANACRNEFFHCHQRLYLELLSLWQWMFNICQINGFTMWKQKQDVFNKKLPQWVLNRSLLILSFAASQLSYSLALSITTLAFSLCKYWDSKLLIQSCSTAFTAASLLKSRLKLHSAACMQLDSFMQSFSFTQYM